MILWEHGDVWSSDKLKTKYLRFGKAYGHETWQVGDWGEHTHEVTCLSNYGVKWGHVTN